MTAIAVTGHRDLTEDSTPLVRTALDDLLKAYADSLFAEAVLAAGGRLTVVIPFQDYRQNKVKPDHAALFDHLVEASRDFEWWPRSVWATARQTS